MRVVPIDKSTDRRQYMKDYYKILGVDQFAEYVSMYLADMLINAIASKARAHV